MDQYYKAKVKVEVREDVDVDPTLPKLDGFLDCVDRESKVDIGWSTPVSPKHGAQKKRKSSSISRNGIDVWSSMGRIKEELHEKYSRKGSNMAGYTHACFHCGACVAAGWSKRDSKTGTRLPGGSWQTTVPLRHLRICEHLPDPISTKLVAIDKEKKKIKVEGCAAVAAGAAMPLKLKGGDVVFSKSIQCDTREAVKVVCLCFVYLFGS